MSQWNLRLNMLFQKSGPHAKVGFSKAMSAGWISVDKKAEGGPKVLRKVNFTFVLIHMLIITRGKICNGHGRRTNRPMKWHLAVRYFIV